MEKMENKDVMSISEINEILRTNFSDIGEFHNTMNWHWASSNICLSERFIREFKDNLHWGLISYEQKLSEDFIREFQGRVYWHVISSSQKLSEDFIREFQDRVYWSHISKFQKLSEDFIREFQDNVDWYYISKHQKLSPEFQEEFKDRLNFRLIENNWIYKDTEFKKQAVMATGLYKCHEDYFIAYKGIRKNRYSAFNFQYQYLKGEIYESWCDCSDNENSFGLSVWTEREAKHYCDQLVVKVKVRYEDVGRVVHDGGKVRCFRIEILD